MGIKSLGLARPTRPSFLEKMSMSLLPLPKATAAARTKVERVVESFESLANAVCTLREKADDDRAKAMGDVIDARAECSSALDDFLAPTLRVVR